MKILPKTLFGRLFVLILSFMICAVLLVRLSFAFFFAHPMGHQLANYSHSLAVLASEVLVNNKAETIAPFVKHLQQSTGTIFLLHNTRQGGELPHFPLFRAWEDAVIQKSNHDLSLSYQTLPQEILWLHRQGVPQFSLGLPFVNKVTVKQFMGVSLLVAFCFSLFSAYIAARYLNRPLKELAEKARLIGQDIDSIAIEPSGPKEIQAVALAMNKMRIDLDNMIKKQKFLLTGISHDLRTPLTRLHIATQILAPDDNGFRDGINADIDEMNEVLHRFIEITRFNIEETELWQVGDIAPLIREVADKYQRSKTELILSLVSTPPIRYKPMALQRYLYNLINNSIKHGGGNITISTQAIGDNIVLSVADQGPGFPLSAEELLNYSDLDRDNKAVNGLGLRIVQLIAKLHEAELTLRNRSEGGAEVLLTLKTFTSVG